MLVQFSLYDTEIMIRAQGYQPERSEKLWKLTLTGLG